MTTKVFFQVVEFDWYHTHSKNHQYKLGTIENSMVFIDRRNRAMYEVYSEFIEHLMYLLKIWVRKGDPVLPNVVR